MSKKQLGIRSGLLVVLGIAVVMATTVGGAQARSDETAALPRSQTLYVSGKQWGPYTDFNPFRAGDYATGVLGLLYETLFRYDPLKDRYIPWLATNGRWAGNTYVVTLRRGVNWSDGRPMVARDVKFSFETGKLTGSDFATLWRTGLQRISTSGNYVVRFHFAGTPNYQQWDWYRYNVPIVPQHIWRSYSARQITTGNNDDTRRLIGTGPFTYGAGKGSSQTLQWNRRDNWWATRALGKRMWMRYIVDIHNTSNTASLQNFIQGRIDLSNNFFPGINRLIRGNVQTYYAKAPYMLAANTAWLVPNTTKAPLNDRNFRRALASSINIGRIVRDDYGNIVSRANPTGLLPTWSKWIDQAQVRRLGFTYNVNRAKQILASNGYRDRNGDGFVENKDGSDINLRLIVPNGWSDWMTANQMIADSAKAAGIRITSGYPDFNSLVSQRNSGDFDLVVNNEVQIGNSPYTYYEYLFRLPIAAQQTTRNFQRYQNQRAWNLTVQLNKTRSTDARAKAIHRQLQQIILTDLPAIPLWYNGMWAQYNTRDWTNFPRATGAGLQNTPSTWNGYINMTGIDALAKLRPR
ncbi:MAG TPA: ABC transporter substrate-binding protein [Gaiellaceae bacterium]|nr:ABC transporter substrate-binding protein [Gaiellaceae bacterium]